MGEHVRIVVIGAGFSGLAMGAELTRAGIDDFTILERADDVGGTWRDNTYPGAACDIRSDLYSLSFHPKPDWARHYGQQPEILEYLRSVADRFDLTRRIRFGTELMRADWDDAARLWRLETGGGSFTAEVLVAGAGPLIEPVWPEVDGLGDFPGWLLHTARWHSEAPIAGRSVAVIGTGASAIQVIPELQKIARDVVVVQRSAPWVIPRFDRPTSRLRRRAFARFPALQRIARGAAFTSAELRFAGLRFAPVGAAFSLGLRTLLALRIRDRALRRKLTPDYRVGCKRVLVSDAFHPAMTKHNVTLVTDGVRFEGDTVVTDAGERYPVDVVVAATGFDATHPPIAALLHGRDGRSLAEHWNPHMTALRGTAVAGFPNMFLLIGPNTVLGHNSMVYVIESQVRYVLEALRSADGAVLEPTVEAERAFEDRLNSRQSRLVWTTGGCSSYYLDAGGRNTVLWPATAVSFSRAVRRFDPAEFAKRPLIPGRSDVS